MGTWTRRALWAAAVVVVALGVAWLMRPQPRAVDVAKVTRGPMQVTLDERGELRGRDRFTIAAPVSGRLARVALRDGDPVAQGQSLATIAPLPLGARERDERTARVAAAEAAQREAAERVQRAVTAVDQARRERERSDRLVAGGFVSPQAAEQARSVETAAGQEAEAARFRERAAQAEVRAARAALLAPGDGAPGAAGSDVSSTFVTIRAPAAGRVLRVTDRSERVVLAGEALMTLADTTRLEAVIEMLSSEAVRVSPGMPVLLDAGTGKPLPAKVRLIEPFAFTKVSALGIEEKRARVVADLDESPAGLGDGYRIEAQVVLWRVEDALQLPASAVFRCGDGWCAFEAAQGRALRRALKLGQRNPLQVQVLDGLAEGVTVVRHPGNDLKDGGRIVAR